MERMEEVGRRLQVRGTLLYLAVPSALSLLGRHVQHIELMRERAISVGVSPEAADEIIEEVKAEALERPDGSLAWIDDQVGRRLFSAVALFDD